MDHIIWLQYFYLVSRIYINSKVYKVNCTSVATEYSIVFRFFHRLQTESDIFDDIFAISEHFRSIA